jgi:hypothetical protein
MTPARERARFRGRVAMRVAALLVAVATLAACASSSTSTSSAPATAVPITDYKMVAGKWAGNVRGLAGPRDDEGDWVQMTIADNGAYEFSIARTIGVASGKGTFTLKDGKLAMEGERGSATFALFERDGRRFLRGDGMVGSGSGTPLTGELRPAR